MNKGCILARAPGGQMQGAATQAMRCHRRGAATQQMPARRRAPMGCGPQALMFQGSVLQVKQRFGGAGKMKTLNSKQHGTKDS